MQNGAIAYNKDWSMRVVPKALHAHFIEGIPISDFIRNHKEIYDFCLSFRARGEWEIYQMFSLEGELFYHKLQKTIRYYISRSGELLIKRNKEDGRTIQLNAGFVSTIFNQYQEKPFEDYEIHYPFYIAEANKIKHAVVSGQLKLF